MNIEVKKQDKANAFAGGLIEQDLIQARFMQLSNKATKTLKVDGFRKGKVPIHIVQSRYGKQLMEDAQSELVKEFVAKAVEELQIDSQSLLGNPSFLKFDKDDKGIALEMRFAIRPEVDLAHLKNAIPAFDTPSVTDDEIEERLKNLSKTHGEVKEVDREVQTGDIAVIDFEGFVDDVAFEGGKAQRYPLEIGSGAFIPGFEEQLVGMKIHDSKDIQVTFPEEYGAPNLAGKSARFHITLHEVKEKVPAAIDEALAKKVLLEEENPSVELLKERIKMQLLGEKKSKLYQEELKQKLVDGLVQAFEIDLPENIVEQEMDVLFRNEINALPQEELESLKGKTEEIKERREKHKEDAQKSVKLTLLIDTIAKEKNISISNQEMWQRLYMEAINLRQDPKVLLEYYQQNGILPAFQMAILEDKVLTFLLDEDSKE